MSITTITSAGQRRGRVRAGIAAALCVLMSSAAWGQIYAGSESGSGAVVLSNFQSEAAPDLVVADPVANAPATPAPHAAVSVNPKAAGPTEAVRKLVDTVARQTQLAPALIHAVIRAESGYNPRALSNRGAIGLMQVMPATGKRFGAQDLYSAEQNVAAGAAYLKWLMEMFGDDLELVLAAYNAGEQAVIKAGRKVPPFPETRAYVRGIIESLRRSASAVG